MKIMVLNGIPNDELYNPYEKALENAIVENNTHTIEYFRVRDMDIKFCKGCWDCWVKTPGKCSIKDDYEHILSRMPNVDLVLYVSPVVLGYESSLLKKCKDRSIPNIHPYIEIFNGEQHHKKRYPKLYDSAVLLITDDKTTDQELEIIKETFLRNAYNAQHDTIHLFTTVNSIGGVQDVINSL